MGDLLIFLICVPATYLIGGIPFGLIYGKVFKGIDIREMGSKNIGAANAFRALGPIGGVLTILLDASKGGFPVYFAKEYYHLIPIAVVFIALAAIAGHNWSIFLRFKGGKGISTLFGVTLVISPETAAIGFLIWLLLTVITKYSALGSIVGSFTLPLCAYFLLNLQFTYTVFFVLIFIFVIIKHKSNIKRLIEGTELKITDKVQKKIH
ncbi:acyl-phosphate glycerol 3-phosphate acyltransferase [Candidatus Berkelbacteria bacterium RIFCSPHIGHO2_12_FULL_36_9]|uniref:Glycerol-3-phosphate acyltransferase n=1 Tax=Candidatus Berkelbacteria bacterium RIFCSPHIGHO2_12_FULL_36_9 TaxID=1797469 RepID=A0A1F5EF82_9BACT|nr:MAG: acyl-phosphate glycerol 3-phosphate acyltransferase [Candidatus Berkelbacteria bacterium RIFCSPHIGHO2_12_FULL_36_9]